MKELKRQLSSGIVGGLYLFITEDRYLSGSYISQMEKIVLSGQFRSLNYSEFDAGTDEESLIRALTSMPFMDEKRMVVVRLGDIKSRNDGKVSGIVKTLSEYVSSPSEYTVLVAECVSVDKRSAFYKLFKEKGKIAEFKKPRRSDFYEWTENQFRRRGINAGRDVVNHIINSVDYNGKESEVDMGYFINEIEKICMIDPGTKTITLDMVKKVTSSGVNADIFRLTDALTCGDVSAVQTQLYKLRYNNIPALKSISTIATTMKNIAICQALAEKGLSEDEIAKQYSIHPYVVKNSISVRAVFSHKDALSAIKALAGADLMIKTGKADEETALWNVCMEICTKTFIGA